MWCQINIRSAHQLASLTRVLKSPNTTFHYARAVRRLNLSSIRADELSDELLEGLETCSRLERLQFPASSSVSSQAFRKLLRGMTELHSLDLSGCREVDDRVLVRIGDSCRRMQGLNLSKCIKIGDRGVKAIAEGCSGLRRVSKIRSSRWIWLSFFPCRSKSRDVQMSQTRRWSYSLLPVRS